MSLAQKYIGIIRKLN